MVTVTEIFIPAATDVLSVMSMATAESVMVKWPNTLFVLCLILEEENGASCMLRVAEL